MTNHSMDLLMYLILGMAIGGIVPIVFMVTMICRGLMISIKEFDELDERLKKVEAKVKTIQTGGTTKAWHRDDLPYDAMGDYSKLTFIEPIKEAKNGSKGTE